MNKTIGSNKYLNLVSWLKKSRQAQGLTLRDLGARLNRPHSFVQKVEGMERKLDIYEYVNYCEALGIKPEEGLKFLKS
jgi:transcriptional regulator with XRE-family HTH domain